MQAGAAYNAIPDRATLSGSLRAARPEDLAAVEQRMRAVIDGAAKATGCDAELTFTYGCPSTNNDPTVIDCLALSVRELLGPESIQWLELPSLGGEDFAFYQQVVPGALFRLGAALADEAARRPLHSGRFDADENAIVIGANLLADAALRLARTFPAP
jgi:metal-dependent amidase/aminoacylase/carboxypeptidase family protein